MSQFNIRAILAKNKIVPVVTINSLDEIEPIVNQLIAANITCIEVTLRTDVAFEALGILKRDYKEHLDVGVGTMVSLQQLERVAKIGVDFIVSPGLMQHLSKELQSFKIPFIPGVVTPSEIIQGLDLGYNTFKLFPAEVVGGVKLLKVYGAVFPDVVFCPTGGINSLNHQDYLALPNVISVGGSWVIS